MDNRNTKVYTVPEKIVDVRWICSEKLGELFFDYRTEGSLVFNENGGLTFTTEEWLCFKGKQLMDSKGLRWFLYVYPLDRVRMYQILYNAIHEEYPFTLTFRVYHPEKGVVWFSAQMEKISAIPQQTERYLVTMRATPKMKERYDNISLVNMN